MILNVLESCLQPVVKLFEAFFREILAMLWNVSEFESLLHLSQDVGRFLKDFALWRLDRVGLVF